MYSIGASSYQAFSNGQVILNVFIDNGFLLVVAVGMTFVILTGGIDLSVGVGRRADDDDRLVDAARRCVAGAGGAGRGPAGRGRSLGFRNGLHHPLLRHPAVHRHAGRDVLRPGLCYRHQHRLDPDHQSDFWTSLAQERIRVRDKNFISPSVVIALVVVAIAVYVLRLHPARSQHLRGRRQPAVGVADGPAGRRGPRSRSTRSAGSARRSAASC